MWANSTQRSYLVDSAVWDTHNPLQGLCELDRGTLSGVLPFSGRKGHTLLQWVTPCVSLWTTLLVVSCVVLSHMLTYFRPQACCVGILETDLDLLVCPKWSQIGHARPILDGIWHIRSHYVLTAILLYSSAIRLQPRHKKKPKTNILMLVVKGGVVFKQSLLFLCISGMWHEIIRKCWWNIAL